MGWPLCVCFTNKATPCLGPGLELRGQLVLDQGKKQQQPVVLMAKEDRVRVSANEKEGDSDHVTYEQPMTEEAGAVILHQQCTRSQENENNFLNIER